MSLILIAVVSILGIISGKLLFSKWINHLTIYCVIMGGLIFLYELKLLPYSEIVPLAWFFVIISFLSLFLGILTVIAAKNLNSTANPFKIKSNIVLPIFSDGGKALKYSVIFFSLIGLFVAVQRWWVLIDMFGSIPAVFFNAAVIYRLNVNREIEDFIPILPWFVYVAVFLSGIYTAYKGKFSFLSFFPILCIILKELTYFGRGEMLFSSIEFFFSFFLFRHLLSNDASQSFRFSKKNAIIFALLFLATLIAAVSAVRVLRGSHENYVGASKSLSKTSENFIISPSVYLYLSSDIGVFSKYIEEGGEDTEFGLNTFMIVYDYLSRLEIVDEPSFFQKGYYIPMWTNTGTFLRELHADFGIAGVTLVPYLLGLIITWLWFVFYRNKNLIVFAVLVYLSLIIGFSFLMMVTRLNQWIMSLIIIILFLPLLEKIAARKTLSLKNEF